MWHCIKPNMIAYADGTTLIAHFDHANSRVLEVNQLNTDLNIAKNIDIYSNCPRRTALLTDD